MLHFLNHTQGKIVPFQSCFPNFIYQFPLIQKLIKPKCSPIFIDFINVVILIMSDVVHQFPIMIKPNNRFYCCIQYKAPYQSRILAQFTQTVIILSNGVKYGMA